MRIRSAGLSHIGLVRHVNEDAFLADDRLRIWAVADGHGGWAEAPRGDEACRMVLDALVEELAGPPLEKGVDFDLPGERMKRALHRAATAVYERSSTDDVFRGNGATVAAMALEGDRMRLAWAGDCRIYRIRGGELQRLTEDHTLVSEQLKLGIVTPEQAATSQFKHIITRAIGAEPETKIDERVERIAEGDRFLLCSDGVWEGLDDARIAGILREAEDPAPAAAALVEAAMAGTKDNLTAVVVDLLG